LVVLLVVDWIVQARLSMTGVNRPLRGLAGVGTLILLLLLLFSKAKASRGMMGIGTLIVFLAVLVVAAIAAAVLISSGTSLQQKALITSAGTKEGILPALDAVSIRGADPTPGGTPHSVTRLYILARLPAGSDALSLNSTIIQFDTTMASQTFTYNGTVANGVSASGTSSYVVTYLKSGPYQEDGYVNLGDMVNVKFNIDGQLGENMRGRITIVPQRGNLNQLEFITPETMVEPMVVLWPTT